MEFYRIMLSEEDQGRIKQSGQVLEKEDMYKFLRKWGAKKQGLKTLIVALIPDQEVAAFFEAVRKEG